MEWLITNIGRLILKIISQAWKRILRSLRRWTDKSLEPVYTVMPSDPGDTDLVFESNML